MQDEEVIFSDDPQYPDVTVQLTGEDGNAFFIIGRVASALRKAGYREAAEVFQVEALQCESYDRLLQAAMGWVNVT